MLLNVDFCSSLYTVCLFPREIVSFVFPRISMFPSTSSRETLRLSGKQNKVFPSGANIKCIIFYNCSTEFKMSVNKAFVYITNMTWATRACVQCWRNYEYFMLKQCLENVGEGNVASGSYLFSGNITDTVHVDTAFEFCNRPTRK
jgi:hypothetical protein